MNRFLVRPAGIGALTVLLVLLDQASKALSARMLKGQAPFVIWDGVFELHYLENRGAAFGMLQGRQQFLLVMGAAVSLIIVCLFFRISKEAEFWPVRLIMICILAGALGNMIDRVRYSYVVDFFYFKLIDFPIFNVADIYVSVGTAALVLLVLFRYSDDDLGRLMRGDRAP